MWQLCTEPGGGPNQDDSEEEEEGGRYVEELLEEMVEKEGEKKLGKIGTKKLKRIQEKAERKAMREVRGQVGWLPGSESVQAIHILISAILVYVAARGGNERGSEETRSIARGGEEEGVGRGEAEARERGKYWPTLGKASWRLPHQEEEERRRKEEQEKWEQEEYLQLKESFVTRGPCTAKIDMIQSRTESTARSVTTHFASHYPTRT